MPLMAPALGDESEPRLAGDDAPPMETVQAGVRLSSSPDTCGKRYLTPIFSRPCVWKLQQANAALWSILSRLRLACTFGFRAAPTH